jgi:pimeloyl-ACP methyl ester carboxylesterase
MSRSSTGVSRRVLAAGESADPIVWPVVVLAVVGVCVSLLLAPDGEHIWRVVWLVVGGAGTWLAIMAWRGPGRPGGFVSLLFGALGLVVGIGIGLRWLGAGAIGFRTIVAIVAFVGGVVLAGLGVARTTKGLRPVIRVVAGAGLILVLAVVVWTLTPAVLATNVPPLESGAATPEDFGLEAREVRYPAEDGTELAAWYIEPTAGATVVLRHGSGSTAADVLPHAAVLANNGYGVLVTDARGHGRSHGPGMDFGWYGTADIEAALSFLGEKPEVDQERIGVVGMSMGGEEAIGAAGADERIAVVVAEGATARTEADKTWLIDEYGWRGWLQTRLEWLQYSVTALLTDADEPTTLASAAQTAAPRPILMITAGEVPDERNAAEHIQAEAGVNVSIWTVPGAGHIAGLQTAPEEWERTVIDFLDGSLGSPT